MSTQLSAIPARQRRRMATAVGCFAVLFLVIAILSLTGDHVAGAAVFAVIGFVVAAVLGLIAWGLVRSVTLESDEARLDAAIEATVRAHGGQMCDCGHEHDPGELHITDADECAHDGTGAACEHDCQTCVLAALRTAP